MRPTKKHDLQRITIKANSRCLDTGTEVTGIYKHRDREQSFDFRVDGSDRDAVLSRDEWDLSSRPQMTWTLHAFRELVADALYEYTRRDGAEDDEQIRDIDHTTDTLRVRFVDGSAAQIKIEME